MRLRGRAVCNKGTELSGQAAEPGLKGLKGGQRVGQAANLTAGRAGEVGRPAARPPHPPRCGPHAAPLAACKGCSISCLPPEASPRQAAQRLAFTRGSRGRRVVWVAEAVAGGAGYGGCGVAVGAKLRAIAKAAPAEARRALQWGGACVAAVVVASRSMGSGPALLPSATGGPASWQSRGATSQPQGQAASPQTRPLAHHHVPHLHPAPCTRYVPFTQALSRGGHAVKEALAVMLVCQSLNCSLYPQV